MPIQTRSLSHSALQDAASRFLHACILPLCLLVVLSAIPETSFAARTVLKVAPYPDLPGDFQRMLDIMETGFEKANPDVDLQLVSMTVEEAYDTQSLANYMTMPVSGKGVHVMEIDTTMLGDLPRMGVVAEQQYTQPDWNKWLVAASAYEGKLYGVPHWGCGNFIITRNETVAGAQTVAELSSTLRKITPKGPVLGGNWAGAPYMALYYSLAYAENNPSVMELNPVMTEPVNVQAALTIRTASDLCADGTSNPCIDGTYHDDPSGYISAVVNGKYAATFGFSESMWYMMQFGANADEWYITPLPIGNSSRYLAVGDSYVVRKGLSAEERDAVVRFYDFMMQDSTYFDIILSGGKEGEQVPRYLIPARTSLLEEAPLALFPYYRRIAKALNTPDSTAYPNLGVADNRERIYAAVMRVLEHQPVKRKRINWRKHFRKILKHSPVKQ